MSAYLFTAPGDKLGMVWSEFDEEKGPRCTVLWSTKNRKIYSSAYLTWSRVKAEMI